MQGTFLCIAQRPSNMSRNYRGGGQRQRDPPGWGNSGQPARTFAFGGGGGDAGAQPQMQNRFQPLQQAPEQAGRGRGGACYTCGQVGHLQRDCPSRRSGGGGAQRPVGADAVAEDMRENLPWPFTCYGPAMDGLNAGPNLLVGDVSFEEARCAAYAALASAGQAGLQACNQRLAEAAQSRQNDRRRLAAMPRAELRMQLQQAAEGMPAQAHMPHLDWSFQAGAVPVTPNVMALPQVYATSQVSPPPFPAEQLQQGPASTPQPNAVWGLPPVSAAKDHSVVPLPAADSSDAASWLAPGFRQGAIPETPPPPQFV